MIKEVLLNKIFKQDKRVKSLMDVKVSDLIELGIKAITLDADNTSSYDGTTTPLPGASEWIQNVKENGIKVILLSNASMKRIKLLADQYDVLAIGIALKPLPFGYLRAVIKLRLNPSEICMIGDQLFTDIMGANLIGMKTIYCNPVALEKRKLVSFKIKRYLEDKIFKMQEEKQKEHGDAE
ncbi:MAG: YqeG family HAD IIIA-type phosphatase [Ruminococcaceae bacterium]|nr:YqeG family HAD IIIA-type phosphatase [Oscillospiraceae bacterium]